MMMPTVLLRRLPIQSCLGTHMRIDGRRRGHSVSSVHRGARAVIVAAPCVEVKRFRYCILLFGSFIVLLSNVQQTGHGIRNNISPCRSHQVSFRK